MARVHREIEERERKEELERESNQESFAKATVIDRFNVISRKKLMSPGFDCSDMFNVYDEHGLDYFGYFRESSDDEEDKEVTEEMEEDEVVDVVEEMRTEDEGCEVDSSDMETSDCGGAFATGCDTGSDVESDMYAPAWWKDM